MRKILLILALIALTGAIGFFVGERSYKSNQDYQLKIKALRVGQNGFINPLLEYEIGSEYYTKELKLFKKPVMELVNKEKSSGKADEIAVYYRELIDGPWIGINEDDKFFPASLLKVPLMIAYFKLSESDPSILQKKITYDSELLNQLGDFNEAEHFKPERSIQKGKEYTVTELIRYMIIYSDNNAKNLLILNLKDVNDLFRVYKDLGFETPPELHSDQEILSVHENASFYRVLFNSSYLNKELSKKALQLLVESKFPHGIVAGLPKDVKIANKFGEYSIDKIKQLHDCGIIYYPENPYILCIMTRGKDFNQLEAVIKDISSLVYREIDKNQKNRNINK